MTKILKQFVDPKTYDYLRSKYQLGYAVGCGIEQTGEILGFNIVVLSQEHKHRFNAVQIKIDDFMDNTITNAIDELSDEDFEKFKDAYIKELQAEILTLDAEITTNYLEISEEFFLFNRKELSAEITRGITKREFQEFYHSFMDRERQRVLCTHVIGNEKREGGDESEENNRRNNTDLNIEFITESFTDEFVIKNIEAFQSEMELYPAVRSHV
jgi:secreted Zn-dependent insulinase-like peptidase